MARDEEDGMRRFWGMALICIISGCGGGETNRQRLNRLVPDAARRTKVIGAITVDGVPVKDLWVTFHPVNQDIKQLPRAQTDDQGRFQITTFINGDGAPAGDYKITIEWLTFTRLGTSRWTGPDKLLDQYNDPDTTPFQAKVEQASLKLPPFELKLQGVKPKSKKRR